jgi:4-amino-4-deoxy-L-arabinose transferase-like glycosyltransferase
MKTKLLFAFIGILILIRLLLVIPAFQDPLRFQLRDSYDYLDLARTLLSTGRYQGTIYSGVDLIRPPGYPIFLLIGLWLSHGSTGFVSLLQVFLSFITAWLVYRVCLELGFRQAGLAAVIFYLINPNAAFWSMVLLTETLAGFWLILGLWCMVHFWTTSWRRWLLGAGLSLSAGALTRPIVLPLAISLCLLFFLLEWRRTHLLVQATKNVMLFAAGLLVLVLPWQLRNLEVHGQFTLSEVGESTFQNWIVAKPLAQAEGISRDEAVSIIANSPNPMQYSLGVIKRYPVIFIKEQGRGILRTLLGAEYGTWATVWGGADTATTGVLSAFLDQGSLSEVLHSLSSQVNNPWFWAGIYALIYDIVLYVAILIGIWRLLHKDQKRLVFDLAILLIFSLFYLLIIPGAAGESRFRVPADPILALTAGLAFLSRQKQAPIQELKNSLTDTPTLGLTPTDTDILSE